MCRVQEQRCEELQQELEDTAARAWQYRRAADEVACVRRVFGVRLLLAIDLHVRYLPHKLAPRLQCPYTAAVCSGQGPSCQTLGRAGFPWLVSVLAFHLAPVRFAACLSVCVV